MGVRYGIATQVTEDKFALRTVYHNFITANLVAEGMASDPTKQNFLITVNKDIVLPCFLTREYVENHGIRV